MLETTDARERALAVLHDAGDATSAARSAAVQRVSEAIPAIVSWLVLLGPIWLSFVDPSLGFGLVSAFIAYFVTRGSLFGVRGLLKRRQIAAAVEADWWARIENGDAPARLERLGT